MKNTIKLLGIIAIVAIISLTLIGCGEREAFLRVVNNHADPITEVVEGGRPSQWHSLEFHYTNLNITTGSSQTFSVGSGWGGGNGRRVQVFFGDKSAFFYDENGGGVSGNDSPNPSVVPFPDGGTVTITLNADGTLTR